MLPAVRTFEQSQLKSDIPMFKPGDSLRVHVRITEGEKSRIQVFEGVCIGRSGSGFRETVTVRRVSYGVGMERIFPLHSPTVEKIEVVRRGKVRRAKLYYLRQLRGKKARITEVSRDEMRKIQASEAAYTAAQLEAATPDVVEEPPEQEAATETEVLEAEPQEEEAAQPEEEATPAETAETDTEKSEG